MKEIRISRVLITAIAVISLFVITYFLFFYINFRHFSLSIGMAYAKSPNENYIVEVNVYPTTEIPRNLTNEELIPYIDENNIDAYVIGYLLYEPEANEHGIAVWTEKNKKIIYYSPYEYSDISIIWLNEDTVVINGTALRMPSDVYDYRRDFF